MFVGHYGASYKAKAVDSHLSLGALFLAAELPDILWACFVLRGIEKAEIDPTSPSTPLRFTYFPYSHSLPAALGWSAAVYAAVKRLAPGPGPGKERAARALGGTVFSHWVLDVLVHRPDLPLWDDAYKVGLGLWNYPIPAFVVESLVLLGGLRSYMRSTAPRTPGAGRYGMAAFGGLLLVFNGAITFGPPPKSIKTTARNGLLAYLAMATVATWLDTRRAPRS